MTPPILNAAGNLAELHALRAYDAVQLATALDLDNRYQAGGLGKITFITADRELLVAAAIEQLHADDPHSHP